MKNKVDDAYVEKGMRAAAQFSVCSSSTLCIGSFLLSFVTRNDICDVPLSQWNAAAGGILALMSVVSSMALYYEPQTIKLLNKMLLSKSSVKLHEYGTTPLALLCCVFFAPVLLALWCFEGYSDVLHSATCRSSASLLFAGTISNICLLIALVTFIALMIMYYVTAAKGFYDMEILKCVCDPLGVVFDDLGAKLPSLPALPALPSLPNFPDLPLPSWESFTHTVPYDICKRFYNQAEKATICIYECVKDYSYRGYQKMRGYIPL